MIDWTRVRELRDEVGAEDFDEVVELFLSEVDDCLENLDVNGPAAQLEADMHYLKGSALNLGFADFASVCQKGEHDAASGKTGSVDIGTVRSLFETSKAEFDRALPAMID